MELSAMGWKILFLILLAILQGTRATNDPQCDTTGTAPTSDDDDVLCPAPAYDCPVDGERWCGTGTECVDITSWCNGVANDCVNNADESICGGPTCDGCTELGTTPVTAGACQPVLWTPPTLVNNNNVLRSDCKHFPGTTFEPGSTTTVVYTVDEDNVAEHRYCKFDVTITAGSCDPVVNNCPNINKVVQADVNAKTAIVTWTEVTSDVDANTVTINDDDYRPGEYFPIGYTRVVYTITKPDETQSFCIFYVNVKRNPGTVGGTCNFTPIVLTLVPPDETATVTDELEEQLETITDAEGEIVSTTTSHETDFAFPLGTTIFVATLVDNDGNSFSCQAPITIQRPFDDIPPVISNCPSSGVTICHKDGEEVIKGAWTEPTASDNILVKDFLANIDPGNYLAIPDGDPATSEVIYTATDWNENEATCEFTLTFEVDNVKPVISNCNNYTEYTTERSGSIEVNYPQPTITDNCDQWQVEVDPPLGTLFAVESTQRITYTATDIADNEAECSFTVQVRIDQFPQFEDCPQSWTISTEPGTTSTEVSWEAPQVVDDNQLDDDNVELSISPGLPGVVLEPEEDQELTLERGVWTVTYSYTDVNLQEGICTFTITVEDAEAPTFDSCPSDMERTLNSVDESVVVEWDLPSAVDNDEEEVTVEIQNDQYESGSPFRSGEYTIVYTATDQSENEGFCSFILTVNAYETSNFWIDCPANIEIETDPGQAYAAGKWDPPELSAGIDNPRWTQTHPAGSNFVIGDTRVEYTVFDRADNSETCTFTVTVVDNEAPVIISCPGDFTVYGLAGRNTVPVFWWEPRTSDNSGSTVSLNANPFGSGTEFGFGTSQVYYSAVDPSGNSISGCHFQVTVVQPGETSVISGSAEFQAVRGGSSTSPAEASNLADDLDTLLRRNTGISTILAGVQVGTPSPLSGGDLLVPFNLYFAQCRAAFLHIRDSLTQNLQGNNRDSFDTNNVIITETFQLNVKEFLVSLLEIDRDLNRPAGEQELIYNGDYSNPRTSAYQNLEDRVCDTMDQLYRSFTGYCGCSIWQFRPGSIVSQVILIFSDSASVSQSALYDQMGNSIDPVDNSLNNLVLENFVQTTVTEVCPDTYCTNGGTCEPNAATYESQCRCPPDYTGTQCQTFSGTSGPFPTPDPGEPGLGLSTEEIIGIVVGVVGGLLLLIILLACFCVFCLRPSEPKPQPIIQEPFEPVYAVEPPRRNVLVRDVAERPPVPCPVPVRVPDPFPVPIRQLVPVPVPRPVPRPVPVPIRYPVPVPVRVPVPVPHAVPRLVPVPIRQPVAVPRPVPVARSVPVAVPMPISVPHNIPIPVREQVPVMQPFGVPVASRQPLGPGLGTGFGYRMGPNLTGFNSSLGLNASLGLNNGFAPNGGFGTGLNGGLNGFNSTRF